MHARPNVHARGDFCMDIPGAAARRKQGGNLLVKDFLRAREVELSLRISSGAGFFQRMARDTDCILSRRKFAIFTCTRGYSHKPRVQRGHATKQRPGQEGQEVPESEKLVLFLN